MSFKMKICSPFRIACFWDGSSPSMFLLYSGDSKPPPVVTCCPTFACLSMERFAPVVSLNQSISEQLLSRRACLMRLLRPFKKLYKQCYISSVQENGDIFVHSLCNLSVFDPCRFCGRNTEPVAFSLAFCPRSCCLWSNTASLIKAVSAAQAGKSACFVVDWGWVHPLLSPVLPLGTGPLQVHDAVPMSKGVTNPVASPYYLQKSQMIKSRIYYIFSHVQAQVPASVCKTLLSLSVFSSNFCKWDL